MPTSITSPGTIDPVRDIEVINTELVLADLERCKRRRERIAKDAKRGDKAALAEEAVLEKIETAPRRRQAGAHRRPHAGGEARSRSRCSCSRDKPTIFACNVKESDLATADQNPYVAEGARLRAKRTSPAKPSSSARRSKAI